VLSGLRLPALPPYILAITSGVAWSPSASELRKLDASADDLGAERPSTVAEMVLPAMTKLSTGNADVAIEAGLRMLGRGRHKGLRYSGWNHTYFERMAGASISRTGHRSNLGQNRLLGTIQKLKAWGRNAEAVFYIHTNIESDNFRPRGSPCLQYVQFRAHEQDKLSVVGLYRAHDYTNKFLGNALGLQNLGEFIARHTGRTYDGQTIISLHPFCEGKAKLKRLIDAVA
jgi:hypothetical protein